MRKRGWKLKGRRQGRRGKEGEREREGQAWRANLVGRWGDVTWSNSPRSEVTARAHLTVPNLMSVGVFCFPSRAIALDICHS